MKIFSFTKEVECETDFFMNKASAQLALIKEATIGLHELPAQDLKDALVSLFENNDNCIQGVGWIEEDETIE